MEDRMILDAQEHMKNLPPSVKRRIKSLKKIQLETTQIEAEFYREVHQLECKYQERYTPLYDRRHAITKGTHEPTEEECDWQSEDEEDEKEEEEVAAIKDAQNNEKPQEPDTTKGIPEFWLTVFNNVEIILDMIQPHDEPILKHLEDLTVSFSEKDPMGFTLHFKFSPNEYFSNEVLTKEYVMKCEPTEEDPFGFEGPEIYKCLGCAIQWKKGKNVTDAKEGANNGSNNKSNRGSNNKRSNPNSESSKADSFFNFFDPPEIPEDPNAQIDADLQELLSMDFEIGHYIREKIIPRAVLYFTGEALEEEEEEDELDDESDDPEDSDEEYDVPKKEECKQQ
eukprot:TRINITY_DN1569_c0_g1_i1.p1 TRINITY_DN1569_c0_g1~~TRINITY_DN1569_c0_g1_i1.p1  ORF type:complete len:338 (+),score=147.02 TRINITY_DN1569_c0_g1_i1:135-1148(+)